MIKSPRCKASSSSGTFSLKNSQGKRKQHDIVDEVVSQIRDLHIKSKNVHRSNTKGEPPSRELSAAAASTTLPCFTPSPARWERIKTTINQIYHNKLKYGIEEAESLRRRRREVCGEIDVQNHISSPPELVPLGKLIAESCDGLPLAIIVMARDSSKTRNQKGIGPEARTMWNGILLGMRLKRSDGGVKTCRIHDLFGDLCIFESRDDKFFEVVERLMSKTTLVVLAGTRSLLCFGQEVYKVKPNHWRWRLKSFKLARVLDLGRMNVNSLPSDLEELIHLRKNDNSFDIHCANGGFLKLQVFEMVGINVKRWTLDKGSMPRFQRLVVKSCKSLTELPKELWSLNSLREVQVWWPCTELANQLQNLKLKNIGCKLMFILTQPMKN
ncbi:Leucine-rich repeat domain superfamily [Sesbania bispinosa]|nr:Leucine-rich repeat domain superfamily [Sesbania bispinosa]